MTKENSLNDRINEALTTEDINELDIEDVKKLQANYTNLKKALDQERKDTQSQKENLISGKDRLDKLEEEIQNLNKQSKESRIDKEVLKLAPIYGFNGKEKQLEALLKGKAVDTDVETFFEGLGISKVSEDLSNPEGSNPEENKKSEVKIPTLKEVQEDSMFWDKLAKDEENLAKVVEAVNPEVFANFSDWNEKNNNQLS